MEFKCVTVSGAANLHANTTARAAWGSLRGFCVWPGFLPRPHYRRRCLRLVDARTLLFLTVRFAGRVLRGRVLRFGSGCASPIGSDCVLTGWGCVLRTAAASISSRSALVGAEGFVISPLFLFRLRGFPSQSLGPQSLVVFLEGLLRYLVFRCCLPFAGVLKSPSRLSSRKVLPCFIAHGSPPISVTSEMTIAGQRRAARKPAD